MLEWNVILNLLLHLSLLPDKDYEFSVNLELITLVESNPFHGYETEIVVAHLTKLNDIAILFAHDEKIRYYYILKLFPFSLSKSGLHKTQQGSNTGACAKISTCSKSQACRPMA